MQKHIDAFENVFQWCLNTAINQWDNGPRQDRVSCISQLIELCISINRMNGCSQLLLAVLKSEGEATTKFQALYLPLMPRLRGLLATHGIAISTYPFDQFTRALIELYLRAVLGPKPQTNVMIRKIGCGCHDCNDLDTFLLSTSIDHHFRLAKARRTHLEMYLRRNTDLVTFQTIRNKSPHSLCVTKTSAVVAALRWNTLQKDARSFFANIGEESVIAEIMGSRYEDVRMALEGRKPYVPSVGDETLGRTSLQPLFPPQPSGSSSRSTPGTSLVAVSDASTSSASAGDKRKREAGTFSDVIDLTG
jgi:hypothetical protein